MNGETYVVIAVVLEESTVALLDAALTERRTGVGHLVNAMGVAVLAAALVTAYEDHLYQSQAPEGVRNDH